MSLRVYVDAYSGYIANERPLRFTLDNETYEPICLTRKTPNMIRQMGKSITKVRQANLRDVQVLVTLWNEYWPEETRTVIAANPRIRPYLKTRADMSKRIVQWLQDMLRSRKAVVFLAVVDGVIVGFLTVSAERNWMIYQNRDFAFLGVLFIRKPYRGLGLSGRLMKEATRWARARKLKFLGLTVLCGNQHAEDIYHRWKFVDVNHLMAKWL